MPASCRTGVWFARRKCTWAINEMDERGRRASSTIRVGEDPGWALDRFKEISSLFLSTCTVTVKVQGVPLPTLISEAVRSLDSSLFPRVVSADDRDRIQWVTGRTKEPGNEGRNDGRKGAERRDRSLTKRALLASIHPSILGMRVREQGKSHMAKEAPSLHCVSSPLNYEIRIPFLK